MPLNRNSFTTDLRSGSTTINVEDIKTDSTVDKTENISQTNFFSKVVDDIKTTNQTDTSVLGSLNDLVLLVGQTTLSENGLYEQTSASATTKQSISNSHFYFKTDGIRAVFQKDVDKFVQVYFDNVNLTHTFTSTSTTQVEVYDIPVFRDNPTIINIELLGYRTSDFTDSFHGVYKRTIFNEVGTLRDGGTLTTQIIRTGAGFSTLPTVTFDVSSNPPKLKITPGDTTSTKWFVRGNISM